MDDFPIAADSFKDYLANLTSVLRICKDCNLMLNGEKCYFMVKKGYVKIIKGFNFESLYPLT